MKEILWKILYVAVALLFSRAPWINLPAFRQAMLWTLLGALAIKLVCVLLEDKAAWMCILKRTADAVFWLALMLRFAGSLA